MGAGRGALNRAAGERRLQLRPARPLAPSVAQSGGSRSARAGLTGLGRPAGLFAGRSRRQSALGPSLGSPRVRTPGPRGWGAGGRPPGQGARRDGGRAAALLREARYAALRASPHHSGWPLGGTRGGGDEAGEELRISACSPPPSLAAPLTPALSRSRLSAGLPNPLTPRARPLCRLPSATAGTFSRCHPGPTRPPGSHHSSPHPSGSPPGDK